MANSEQITKRIKDLRDRLESLETKKYNSYDSDWKQWRIDVDDLRRDMERLEFLSSKLPSKSGSEPFRP